MTKLHLRPLALQASRRGISDPMISACFGVTQRTVSRWRARAGKKKSARQAPPNVAQRRKLVEKLARETAAKGSFVFPQFGTARALAAELLKAGHKVSRRTVCRDLRKMGGRNRVRPRVPTRQVADFNARLRYAKQYRKVSARRWVFSDETWVTCNEGTSRTQWVFFNKKLNKFDSPFPIQKKSKWNVASLQVWAACGYNFKGPLVVIPSWSYEDGVRKGFRLNAQSYVKRCLSKIAERLRAEKRLFLQDGARSHASQHVAGYLKRKGIQYAEFPSYSPDLNRQECLWGMLKRRLGDLVPTDLEDLKKKVLQAWDEIPQPEINKLCLSYPDTLNKLIEKKGATDF